MDSSGITFDGEDDFGKVNSHKRKVIVYKKPNF